MLPVFLVLCFVQSATGTVSLFDAQDAPPACVCPANQRSIWDIVWSCLATIFACTWVSIHPNIPAPDLGYWKIFRRRLNLMFWAVIAPELMILWAIRQWDGARWLARHYKDKGWTKTHGHFLQMGGFMLTEGKTAQGVISPWQFPQLLGLAFNWDSRKFEATGEKARIHFPETTEEWIQDKSKGDGLSKALVIVQTTWFVAQCIARWVQGLIVTKLELTTLAFAALNGIIYFLWWNKPLDVRFGVPLRLLEDPQSFEIIVDSSDRALNVAIEADTNATYAENRGDLDGGEEKITSTCQPELPQLLQKGEPLISGSKDSPGTISNWIEDLKKRYLFHIEREGDMEVSPLYAYTWFPSEYSIMAVTSGSAILFGAIHCGGWSFQFQSSGERVLWRVCALIITIVPLLLFARSLARRRIVMVGVQKERSNYVDSGPWSKLLFYTILFFIPFYVAARFGLLVEAFVSLRDLPPGAQEQLNWTHFVPHI